MTDEEFKEFMAAQVEHFRTLHGDCNGLKPDEIAEDSLEFRRRWDKRKDDDDDAKQIL